MWSSSSDWILLLHLMFQQPKNSNFIMTEDYNEISRKLSLVNDFRRQKPIRITNINPVPLLISGWDVLKDVQSIRYDYPGMRIIHCGMNESSYNYKRQVSMGMIPYFRSYPGDRNILSEFVLVHSGRNQSSLTTAVNRVNSVCFHVHRTRVDIITYTMY